MCQDGLARGNRAGARRAELTLHPTPRAFAVASQICRSCQATSPARDAVHTRREHQKQNSGRGRRTKMGRTNGTPGTGGVPARLPGRDAARHHLLVRRCGAASVPQVVCRTEHGVGRSIRKAGHRDVLGVNDVALDGPAERLVDEAHVVRRIGAHVRRLLYAAPGATAAAGRSPFSPMGIQRASIQAVDNAAATDDLMAQACRAV